MDAIYWDHYYNQIIILNLLIVIGLFTGLRLFSGALAHINASKELLTKDNPAFGVSLAGTTLAVAVMLSGTVYGSPGIEAEHAVLSVGVFGLIGIALMAITRIIFDKITLPTISLRDEIVRGNLAVAVADTANVLAAAIIIRTVLIWVTGYTLDSIYAILGGYVVSQIILTVTTIVKTKVFHLLNKGRNLSMELMNGNRALALRFAGQKIGVAFSIAAAAHIVVYEQYELGTILFAWFVASVVAVIIWKILCIVAENIILWKVDIRDEVMEQRNIAVGALQAAICISMGLLIAAV